MLASAAWSSARHPDSQPLSPRERAAYRWRSDGSSGADLIDAARIRRKRRTLPRTPERTTEGSTPRAGSGSDDWGSSDPRSARFRVKFAYRAGRLHCCHPPPERGTRSAQGFDGATAPSSLECPWGVTASRPRRRSRGARSSCPSSPRSRSSASWFGGLPLGRRTPEPAVRCRRIRMPRHERSSSSPTPPSRRRWPTSRRTSTSRRRPASRPSIKPQDSADTAAVFASAALNADAWVPESSVWVDRMTATAASLGQTAPEVEVGEPIATTPVVFAAAATKAAEIASAPVTWTRVLGGALPTILPNPEASSASLAGLLALRGHSSPDDPRQFAGAMIELGKSIPASTSAAFGALATAPRRAWSSRPRRRSPATTSTTPTRRSSRPTRPTAPCSSTTRS